MPLSLKESKDNLSYIEFEPQFELRSKVRGINTEKVKYYLENEIPIIEETDNKRYKLRYQIDKNKYLSIYVIKKIPKGLKILTCFIELIRK